MRLDSYFWAHKLKTVVTVRNFDFTWWLLPVYIPVIFVVFVMLCTSVIKGHSVVEGRRTMKNFITNDGFCYYSNQYAADGYLFFKIVLEKQKSKQREICHFLFGNSWLEWFVLMPQLKCVFERSRSLATMYRFFTFGVWPQYVLKKYVTTPFIHFPVFDFSLRRQTPLIQTSLLKHVEREP